MKNYFTVLFLVTVAKLSAQEKGSYKSLLEWSIGNQTKQYEMTVQSEAAQ
jgi:hypothetical protein